MATRLDAGPQQTPRSSKLPTIITAAALSAFAAVNVGLNIHWDHQRGLYERFTRAYSDCLAGTAWDVRTAPGEIRLNAPPRLRMYGTGTQVVLVFAAETFVGSDRLHAADAATAQVLSDRQCPAA